MTSSSEVPATSPTRETSDNPAVETSVEGKSQLPTARVKRIIKEDKDVHACSSDSVFLISIATEMFVEYLTQAGYNYAKIDRRKTVQYKDLATAVLQIDQLEFLTDVIPQTMAYNKAIETIQKNA